MNLSQVFIISTFLIMTGLSLNLISYFIGDIYVIRPLSVGIVLVGAAGIILIMFLSLPPNDRQQ